MRNIFMIAVMILLSYGIRAEDANTKAVNTTAANTAVTATTNGETAATTTDTSPIEKIGHEAFMKAPGLTDAQRIKLSEIMKNTFMESKKIRMEIASQKIDLFDAITNPSAKSSDVTKIKNKIMDLDKKRMALMFKSLDDVQKVIGKNPETGKYLRNIMKEKIQIDDHSK